MTTEKVEDQDVMLNNSDVGEQAEDSFLGDDFGMEDEVDETRAGMEEMMDADNPLLKRVQDALKKQLQASFERLELQIREKEEAVTRVKSRREEIGVELYGLQQQLAKLQIQLENIYKQVDEVKKYRLEEDDERDQIRDVYEEHKVQVGLYEQKWKEIAKQLEIIRSDVRVVENALQESEKVVLTRKKETFSTEETIQEMEKEKMKQDLLINSLTQQIHLSQTQIETCKQQTELQEKETHYAKETLIETNEEMKNIRVEKRQFFQSWKAKLIEIETKKEVLQECLKEAEREKERIENLHFEIEGTRDEVTSLEDTNNQLMHKDEIIAKQINVYEQNVEDLKGEKEAIKVKVVNLREKILDKDREITHFRFETKEKSHMVQLLDKKFENIVQERHKIEQAIDEEISSEMTLKHGTEFQDKELQKTRAKIHEKEITQSKVNNQIARLRLQAIKLEDSLEDLQSQLTKGEEMVSSQEKLIDEYKLDVKKREDEIKKKQNYIDRLNRKYETLTASKDEDGEILGPLENSIKRLEKEVHELSNENEEIQKEWIKNQTELVNLTTDVEKSTQHVNQISGKKTLLSQISVRLEDSVTNENKELDELRRDIKGLGIEMTKVNRLVSYHRELLVKMENEIETDQIMYAEEIQELKEADLKIKKKVNLGKEEKENLHTEIMDLEREILLWERKIQIEVETQKALDPSYGMAELREMKKEVHRMELRLNQLKRKQEEMIQEMELAISKREVIHLRGMGKNKKEMTQNTIRRKIEQLKGQIRKTNSNKIKLENQIQINEQELETLLPVVESKQDEFDQLEEQVKELEQIVEYLECKKTSIEKKSAIETKKCGEIEKFLSIGKRKSKTFGRKHLLEQQTKKQKLFGVLNDLQIAVPQHRLYFEAIRNVFEEDESSNLLQIEE